MEFGLFVQAHVPRHEIDADPEGAEQPQVPPWPQLIAEPTPEELEQRIKEGVRMVGDPEECRRGIQKYVDVGCDQLIFGVLASTQPMDFARESTALFSREVMPHFDRNPVHRTTRMREAAVQKRQVA